MTEQKPLRWKLTSTERAQLQARERSRIGALKLLADLQHLKGLEAKQEEEWWENVARRCKIPPEHRFELLASASLGEIWVRGHAEPLDEHGGLVDNPAL